MEKDNGLQEPVKPDGEFNEDEFLDKYGILSFLQSVSIDNKPKELAAYLGMINANNRFLYKDASPSELADQKRRTIESHRKPMSEYSVNNLESLVGDVEDGELMQLVLSVPAHEGSGFDNDVVASVADYQSQAEKAASDETRESYYKERLEELPESSQDIVKNYDPEKFVEAEIYNALYRAQSHFVEESEDETGNKKQGLERDKLVKYAKSQLDYWKNQDDEVDGKPNESKGRAYGITDRIAQAYFSKKMQEKLKAEQKSSDDSVETKKAA